MMVIIRTGVILGVLLFAKSTTYAQSGLDGYERVLVPLYASAQSGAFGSVWSAQLYVRHYIDRNIVLGYDTGGTPFVLPVDSTYAPSLFPRLPGEPEGALIYIDTVSAAHSDFNLRVRDSSRSALSAGVSVPVVREGQLLTGRHSLLSIPVDPRFRYRLRIYEPFLTDARDFEIRLYDDRLGRIIAAADITLSASDRTIRISPSETVPIRPAAAEFDLAEIFPAITDYERVTIDIKPRQNNQRWWAFVSVTNNVTQEVTIVTP